MAGLASLATGTAKAGFGENRTNAMLFAIDPAGNLVVDSPNQDIFFNTPSTPTLLEDLPGPRRFQYFPETLTDTKAVNYQKKDIPGASLPIYQWINSGERVISFSTVFTSDTDLTLGRGRGINEALLQRHKNSSTLGRNVDCRSAVAWLRSFTMPRFVAGGSAGGQPLSQAPARCLLHLEGSGIGIAGGGVATPGKGDVDAVMCLMSQCDVQWEAFFPSGFPRVVSVNLSFVEIAQSGAAKVEFPSFDVTMARTVNGFNRTNAGYFLYETSHNIR